MNVYKKLRVQAKQNRGRTMTVRELSKKIGVSPSCISKIERNINIPKLEIIIAYQRYFEVPYSVLIEPFFQDYHFQKCKK